MKIIQNNIQNQAFKQLMKEQEDEKDNNDISEDFEDSERRLNDSKKNLFKKRASIKIDRSKLMVITQNNEQGVIKRSQTFNQDFIDKNYENSVKRDGGIIVHGQTRIYDQKALFCLTLDNKVRRLAIWITEWKQELEIIHRWFERAIIFVIFINSLCLALTDYNDREKASKKNQILDILSTIFNGISPINFNTVIFIIECILKIIARGFIFHKNSYLKDTWNIVDFIVVLSAILEFLPLAKTTSFKSIRSIRAIRPLRSINAIPSMKTLVKILLKSLPNLINVVLLLTFLIILFGILGLHFFAGRSYARCRTTPEPVNATYWPKLQGYEQLCTSNPNSCPVGSYCGHPEQFNISLENDGVSSTKFIQYGVVQFDNIGSSVLTVFEVLTIFGWSDIMYNYMESTTSYFPAIFFSVLVIFGNFFLLNLILAVIVDAYKCIDIKEKNKIQALLEHAAQKKQKKYDALKTVYRMMRISQKKREIMESAGLEFRWSFFDVVFELVRVERYENIRNKSQSSPLTKIKDHFDKKITTVIKLDPVEIEEIESPLKRKTDNKDDELQVSFAKSSSPQWRRQLNSFKEDEEEKNEESKQSNIALVTFKKQSSKGFRDEGFQGLDFSSKVVLNQEKIITNGIPIRRKAHRSKRKENGPTTDFDFSKADQSQNQLSAPDVFQREPVIKIIPPEYNSSNSPIGDQFSNDQHIQIADRSSLRFIIQNKFRIILESSWFEYLMSSLIICNTIVMATDRYPKPDYEQKFSDYANLFFFICFSLEFIIKMIGLGIKGYFREGFNIFDAFIILISSIDIILNAIEVNKSSSSLSVLRGIRILRILKLAKTQENLKNFYQTIIKTLVDLRNFSVLLFLVIITYTLLGLEFFAFKMKFNSLDEYDLIDGVSPRQNFDGFMNAFTTVFNILQGEGYYIIMYNVGRSVGKLGLLYFVSLILFGQIILLKLFLAVMLDNFEDKRKEIDQRRSSQVAKITLFQRIKYLLRKLKSKIKRLFCKNRLNLTLKMTIAEQIGQSALQEEYNHSLFIFQTNNPIRKFILKFTSTKWFEYLILLFILISSILMALDNPLDAPNTKKQEILYYCNFVITIVFTLEALLKIVANGFVFNGTKSYLRNYWNQLDFFIVLVSLITDLGNNKNLKMIRILRLIRVLRPLRVIGKNEGLKLAVQTMIMALPHILNVLMVNLLFYLIFGIFCVSFLKGQFYYCYINHLKASDPDFTDASIITMFDCINIGGEWQNKLMNFDNTVEAMQMLYSMSIVDWNARLLDAVDAVGIGFQPKQDNNRLWVLYFDVFMIIFAFFLLNLFVGVVVNTFNTEKERLGKNFLLTDTQREWLHLKMILLNTKPAIKKILRTSNVIRKACFYLVHHPAFDWVIVGCILSNTVILCIHWYQISPEIENIVSIFNYFFAIIFTIESILKIIALGRGYFRENWNIFDFLIVLATIVGVILDLTTEYSVGGKATIVRAFRVARMLRIIKRAKVLKIIIDTLIITLPSLLNVGGLLLLIIYVYAILGMQLFSTVKLGPQLNNRSNFLTFGRAFLTLIRFATGEGWDYVFEDMANPYSILNQCEQTFSIENYLATNKTNGCGNNFARFYLISFSLMVTIIFLNLFVAIVLESFNEINKKENKLLSDEVMEHLRQCWAEYDEEGTFFISVTNFGHFLSQLKEPLGFSQDQKNEAKLQEDLLKHLELPTYNTMQSFYYYDVVQGLAQYAYMKMEAERMLKQRLMNASFNIDDLNIEVLESVKKELEFRSDLFKQKEVIAFREVFEKERKLYSKLKYQKDNDIDSQHFWAGGKILNMFGKTNMNFKGGVLKRKTGLDQSSAMKSKNASQINDLNQSQLDFIGREISSTSQPVQHNVKIVNSDMEGEQISNFVEEEKINVDQEQNWGNAVLNKPEADPFLNGSSFALFPQNASPKESIPENKMREDSSTLAQDKLLLYFQEELKNEPTNNNSDSVSSNSGISQLQPPQVQIDPQSKQRQPQQKSFKQVNISKKQLGTAGILPFLPYRFNLEVQTSRKSSQKSPSAKSHSDQSLSINNSMRFMGIASKFRGENQERRINSVMSIESEVRHDQINQHFKNNNSESYSLQSSPFCKRNDEGVHTMENQAIPWVQDLDDMIKEVNEFGPQNEEEKKEGEQKWNSSSMTFNEIQEEPQSESSNSHYVIKIREAGKDDLKVQNFQSIESIIKSSESEHS